MPVTMKARDSVPSVCPHAFASPRSKEDARPISVIGPVDPRALGPDVFNTPCASVQLIGAMLGLVPVGALTGPTLWHEPFNPSCNSMLAFESCSRVGGELGSN